MRRLRRPACRASSIAASPGRRADPRAAPAAAHDAAGPVQFRRRLGRLSQPGRARPSPPPRSARSPRSPAASTSAVDYFIATPDRRGRRSTRAGERADSRSTARPVVYERLGADFPGNVLSSFVLDVPPGYRSETVSHEGEEFLFVLDGLDHPAPRRPGNGASRPATACISAAIAPHSWSNDTDKPARLLWTGTLAMFRSRAGPRPALRNTKAAAPGKKTTGSQHTGETTDEAVQGRPAGEPRWPCR